MEGHSKESTSALSNQTSSDPRIATTARSSWDYWYSCHTKQEAWPVRWAHQYRRCKNGWTDRDLVWSRLVLAQEAMYNYSSVFRIMIFIFYFIYRCQILTNFQDSFSRWFPRKFAVKRLLQNPIKPCMCCYTTLWNINVSKQAISAKVQVRSVST